MRFLLRIFAFIGLVIFLYFGALMMGGVYIGARIGVQHVSDPATISQLSFKEGYEFASHYRPIILAVDVVISAFIAFGLRWGSALFSIPLAVLVFLGLQNLKPIQMVPFPSTPKSIASPTRTIPKPTRAIQQGTLLSPVMIPLP